MTRRNSQSTSKAASQPKVVAKAKPLAKPKPAGKSKPAPKLESVPAPRTQSVAPSAAREKPPSVAPVREAIVEGAIVDRRYQVRRVISTEGKGVVVEAEHIHTRRRHALKAHKGTDPVVDSERRRRLLESTILATTRHPNIVDVHDAGECPIYGPFVVLELLEGRSVETIATTRGALPLSDALSIIHQLCAGLEHVHTHGYIHGDVKPGNLVVARAPNGREIVKLIDFGLATEGTETLDARADVHAAAVIFYEMLTGKLPDASAQARTGNATHAEGSIAPPSKLRDELGPRFDAVIASALARNHADRFATAKAFADAIERAADLPLHTTRLLTGLENRDGALTTESEIVNVDSNELVYVAPVPPPLPEHVRARRRHRRAPLTTPVRVTWSGGVADGRTEDLSEGGMLVMLDGTPREGTNVEVRFDVPGTNNRAVVASRVQWVKTGHRRTAAGIEFLSISDALRRAIADLVSSEQDHHGSTSDSEKEGSP